MTRVMGEEAETIAGPRPRELFSRESAHMAPGLQSIALYSGLAMARGRGTRLFDEDGNEYIDFVAGIGVGGVGHCHRHYVETLKRQLEQLEIEKGNAPGRRLEYPPSLTEGSHHADWFAAVADEFVSAMSEGALSESLSEAATCLEAILLAQESSREGGRRIEVVATSRDLAGFAPRRAARSER